MMLISKEAPHATCIKEAEANCASIIAEVENCCSTAIRKAESHGAKQAHSIQQSYVEGMQCLEVEAIGEEGKDHLSFLVTCGAALWASPQRLWGSGNPLPPAPGKCALVYSTKHSSQYLLLNMNLPHWFFILLPPWHLGPWPYPNGDTPPPARLYPHLNWKPPQEWSLRSHPTQREWRTCLFTKH